MRFHLGRLYVIRRREKYMKAYERLLKYVKVYTTSDENSDTHPTTIRQFDLAKYTCRRNEGTWNSRC